MLARTLPKAPIFFNPGISLRAADLAKLLLRAEWLAKGCGSTAAHAYAGLETSRQGPHLVAAVIGGRSCSTMRAHLRHAAHGPQPSGTSPAHPPGIPRTWALQTCGQAYLCCRVQAHRDGDRLSHRSRAREPELYVESITCRHRCVTPSSQQAVAGRHVAGDHVRPKRRMIMNIIIPALIALSLLAGIAAPASAYDPSVGPPTYWTPKDPSPPGSPPG